MRIHNDGHAQGNRDASGSREPLVQSKPFRQPGVTDQPKGNSNDPGAKHGSCDPLQHFGESDQREAGPKAEDQNTQGDGHHAGRDQQSFRPHGIDERATRHLANQTGRSAYGQGKPDVFGCPPMYR